MSSPPAEIPDPDRSGASSPEVEPTSEAARLGFPCATCGAPSVWDPETDALACEHCGTSRPVPRAEGTILERPLEDAGLAARGLGLEARAVRCLTCGASVALPSLATAASCAFCGSSNVLAQEANRNALRPESVIPLDVGRSAAEQHFRRWLGGLWFRPGALKRLKRFEAVGVYVPYWTFDAQVHSDWSADAGHYYYETQMVPVMRHGRLRLEVRRVQKVRWVPAWGKRDDSFDDLLVNASRGVPDALSAKLGGFDTKKLVPYRPEYLAGWRAEEYQLDLEQSWVLARDRIVQQQQRRCAGDVPGDTQRNLQVSNDISGVRWKHVLLPIWTLTYPFGGKSYTVLVNGQSGRVHGEAPLSWIKILLLVLGLAMVALTIAGIAALSS